MSKNRSAANVTKYQKFEMATVNRAEIKAAEYNPRIISDGNAARLKKGIKAHGLVQPIVWNRRTGNVVGGHQRLAQIDALEKRGDYDIMVAVVDISEEEERTVNIQLNNDSMMGEWDTGKLKEIVVAFDFDCGDLGFSEADASILFSDDDRFAELIGDIPEVAETKDRLCDIKNDRKEMNERMRGEQSAAFYFTVVCDSAKDKESLLARLGVPAYEEFVGAFAITRALDAGSAKRNAAGRS